MIFDCFPFFNELDLLELRLKLLDEYVDYFVINESTLLQGINKEKPLYYLENKKKFEKWEHKIIHNIVDDVPDQFTNFDLLYTEDGCRNTILNIIRNYKHYPHDVWRYGNETYQKECILRVLDKRAKDEDIVLISDVDEIPNLKSINFNQIPDNTHLNLIQSNHQFYVNVMENGLDWFGTRIYKHKYMKFTNVGICGMRMNKQLGINVKDGGWHLSFLGGTEKIKEKIKAYGHQEFNNDYILSNIENRVKDNSDLFGRGYKFTDISLDFFPKNFVEIIKDYPHFIKY